MERIRRPGRRALFEETVKEEEIKNEYADTGRKQMGGKVKSYKILRTVRRN